jgi:hypothetical protein
LLIQLVLIVNRNAIIVKTQTYFSFPPLSICSYSISYGALNRKAIAAAFMKAEFRRFPRLIIIESSSRLRKKQIKHTAMQVYQAPFTGT